MKSLIYRFLIISLIMMTIEGAVSAQQRMFFSVGYGLEGYSNTDAVALAVNSYNQYNASMHYIPEAILESPGKFGGMLLGVKTNFRKGGMAFGLHWSEFKSTATGTDSTLAWEYIHRIKIGNVGISLGGSYYILASAGFRSGPALALNIEKFGMYCRDNIAYGTTAWEKPVDKFMMGLSLKWPISFGRGKFNFDVIPYYTLPFWKVDAEPFNEELNTGHQTIFNAEQMTLKPVRWGVAVTLNFCFLTEEE
jgi:hypothetical protein